MKSIINELWHGNLCPQSDSRNNSHEMKELMKYMARHHDDLLKSMIDEQKETFEKFDDCWSEYMSLSEAAIFEYAFKLGTANMEKVLSKNPGNEASHIKAEFVLEINMNLPIAAKLKELFENDKDRLANYSKVLYAQARLVSGLSIENPAEISDLVCNLMLQ